MNTTVVSPSPAVFICVADGVTTPVMTWWRREPSGSLTQLSSDGINVTIREENLDSRTVRSNLTILQPLPVDTAEYVCMATNEINADHLTASAVLTVYGRYQLIGTLMIYECQFYITGKLVKTGSCFNLRWIISVAGP